MTSQKMFRYLDRPENQIDYLDTKMICTDRQTHSLNTLTKSLDTCINTRSTSFPFPHLPQKKILSHEIFSQNPYSLGDE